MSWLTCLLLIVATVATCFNNDLAIVLALASVGLLSSVVGCLVECGSFYTVFLSTGLLTLLILIISSLLSLSQLQSFLLLITSALTYSLLLVKFKEKMELISSFVVSLSGLLSAILMYVNPLAASEGASALNGSIWYLDPSTVYALFPIALMIFAFSVVFRREIVASLADYEYLESLLNAKIYLMSVTFLIVIGTALAILMVGVFATYVLLYLPALIILKIRKSVVEAGLDVALLTYSVYGLSNYASVYINIMPEGLSALLLSIMAILLLLWERVSKRA